MHQGACLLLHGFTGGPFELQPLTDPLESRGWHCFTPTLPGHGQSSDKLKHVHWTEWVLAAEQEAGRLAAKYGEFDLVGFSMGGLIAAYIANRFPVRRLVLLNAAVIFVSPGRFASDILMNIRNKQWSRFHKISSTPIRAVWQFMRTANQLRPELKKIRIPTLIVQGERDQIIHPYSAKYIYRSITCERQVEFFPKSRHLICWDEEADDVIQTIVEFLEQ